MPDITVKTMKGDEFPVTVDDGATVMNLAEKIAEKKPEMEPGSMKLTCKYASFSQRRQMLATDSLSKYKISSTGFVEVTVSKPMVEAGKALLQGALSGDRFAPKAAAEKAAAAEKLRRECKAARDVD